MIKTCIRSIIRASTAGSIGGAIRRLVYTLDGVDDYIQLPSISLGVGDTVEFDLVTGPGTGLNRTLLGSSPSYLQISDGGLWNVFGFTFTVDGIPKVTNDLAPQDGFVHKIVATSTGSQTLAYIGCLDGASLFSSDSIRNLKVGSSHFYPINDGWVHNPVIRDTLGGQHGTAVNFLEVNWIDD